MYKYQAKALLCSVTTLFDHPVHYQYTFKINYKLPIMGNILHWQQGQVVKSAKIVIDMILVQNLLKPFCCFLGKDTLRRFSLLGGLSK